MKRRAVFQTDQLTCYDSDGHQIPCTGTGQDGETRSGLPWPVSRFTPAGRRVFDRLCQGFEISRSIDQQGDAVGLGIAPAISPFFQDAFRFGFHH